jgi:hypothetical protein
LATLTGEPLSRVEAVLVDVIGNDPTRGVKADEMARAFHHFGFVMDAVAAYRTPFSGPPLGRFLDALAPAWRRRPLVIAVEERGDDPHWVTAWGEMICDSLSKGRWVPLAGSRHRGALVSHAHMIAPTPIVAGPVEMR